MSSPNKDLVHKWFIDITMKGNLDLIESVVHPEYKDGPNHKGPTGPEFVRVKFGGILKVFDAFEIIIKDLIEEGDKVVCHYLFKVIIKDSFMGINAPGGTFDQEGVSIFHIKDNKIYYTWGTYDRQIIIKQLQEQAK